MASDVDGLQLFVSAALSIAAAQESDILCDQLHHLRRVGDGFASLIYKLPIGSGFTELKLACSHVWEALDKNKNLLNILVS